MEVGMQKLKNNIRLGLRFKCDGEWYRVIDIEDTNAVIERESNNKQFTYGIDSLIRLENTTFDFKEVADGQVS